MKFLSLIMILSTASLLAGAPAATNSHKNEVKEKTTVPENKESKAEVKYIEPKKDIEAEENLKRVFYKKLDPASILNDTKSEFVEMEDVAPLKEEFQEMGQIYREKKFSITLPGYIFSEAPRYYAEVLHGLVGEEMQGPGNKIVVEASGTLDKGKVYSLLRKVKTVKSAFSGIWYHFIYVGDVELIEFEDKNRAIAFTQSNTVASKGDLLVTRISAQREIDVEKGFRKPFEGKPRIISLTEEDSTVVGEGGFVFLDKGSDSGLQINQLFNIYLDPKVHSLKGFSSTPVGTVQIIDMTSESSTGYIVRSRQDVTSGDYALSE